jgi:hypothetical protein
VVAWESGHDGFYNGIYAQRYNAAGVAQGGEFGVNTSTSLIEIQPAVAMDADGDFVVTWSHGYNGYYAYFDYDIYAQRYNATGVAQGGEFRVSSSTLNDVTSTVGMDADGDFVIAWTSGVQELEIFAQRYNAAGAAQGAAVRVNRAADDVNVAPAVARTELACSGVSTVVSASPRVRSSASSRISAARISSLPSNPRRCASGNSRRSALS